MKTADEMLSDLGYEKKIHQRDFIRYEKEVPLENIEPDEEPFEMIMLFTKTLHDGWTLRKFDSDFFLHDLTEGEIKAACKVMEDVKNIEEKEL